MAREPRSRKSSAVQEWACTRQFSSAAWPRGTSTTRASSSLPRRIRPESLTASATTWTALPEGGYLGRVVGVVGDEGDHLGDDQGLVVAAGA
ncbi:hypothetical protein [Streptomyces sp. NPDC001933]|uniref:hypothetical protein n=1 Tax=Streptomyces sp. NPDC001933 TaxID=3364626 RepID=UPI00368A44EA